MYCLNYFNSLHFVVSLKQIGVRTEGIQEALLQSPAADDTVDRITKLKRTLRAVSYDLHFIVSFEVVLKTRLRQNTYHFSVFSLKLTNWKALPNNQTLASVYIKLLGQEVAYRNIDKTIIEQAIPVLYYT